MAYLVVKRISGGDYHYIIESRRRGSKVRQRILEYLGKNPDPKRLKRALKYWRVKS